ncbi:FAD dependent oxidoreductase [Hypomontagnella monticulosa]|nr:FAD dependent oxidoreductase [Hypomontagnella monticulosa]
MFARAAQRRLLSAKLISVSRLFSSTTPLKTDFDHVVIGGGVVGLAIARSLALHPSSPSTLLVERHRQTGTETSSRNSEVIHAGLYYPPNSLKTRLCIAGRQALYAFCAAHHVPHARVGKWIVAQDEAQLATLERIHALCRDELDVPTRWVGAEEAEREEPVVRARAGVLESSATGIVDSHAFMTALQGQFEDAGGVTAVGTAVLGIEPLKSTSATASSLPGSGGWRLLIRDAQSGEESSITAATLINSAGLGAADVHNMIVPAERQTRLFYAKGNYFSYASSAPKVRRLVYPVTAPGAGGLGTHLTLDLAGRMRFGPDVEWTEDASDYTVNPARLDSAIPEIRKYLPDIDVSALAPDYAGVRPKLRPAGTKEFIDFYIRKEDGFEGWVNLLGIESPGLTSSLAIGELVRDMLYGSRKVEGSPTLVKTS